MLPDDEILRRIRIIRHSSKHLRNARKAPSINGLATAANIARCHLHDLEAGRRNLGPVSRAALSQALTCLPMYGARSSGRAT